jgi:hypothetical protein
MPPGENPPLEYVRIHEELPSIIRGCWHIAHTSILPRLIVRCGVLHPAPRIRQRLVKLALVPRDARTEGLQLPTPPVVLPAPEALLYHPLL